ncbi:hypothetical protein K503DRAFT_696077, partial [Rhizopogon vinicolor AM-OR11-026]
VAASGSIPTHSWLMCILSYLRIAGHSMRAGKATALVAAGTAPDLIRAAGRRSCKEFQIYIRQHLFVLHANLHVSASS